MKHYYRMMFTVDEYNVLARLVAETFREGVSRGKEPTRTANELLRKFRVAEMQTDPLQTDKIQ